MRQKAMWRALWPRRCGDRQGARCFTVASAVTSAVSCCAVSRYETALAELQEEQRAIDRRVARGGFRSKDRDMALQVGW